MRIAGWIKFHLPLFGLSLLLLVASAWPARAQQAASWPHETIRIIVPYAPGGLTDVVGRTLSVELAKSLHVAVVVENKAGASSLIGTEYVAKARPDGYTLLVGAGPMAIAEYLYPKLAYNPGRDFVPISLIAQNGLVLIATNSGFEPNSVAAVVALAKMKPGAIGVASFGNGTLSHMALEKFSFEAGVALMHVPYKGTAQAMPDVIGGQVPLMFDNIATALPQIQSGKVRALAYTGAARSPLLPLVPTFHELGFPGVEATNFYGVFAPAGTSPAVVSRLNEEVARIFGKTEVRQLFLSAGAEVLTSTPEAFAKFLKVQGNQWAAVIRARGIKPD